MEDTTKKALKIFSENTCNIKINEDLIQKEYKFLTFFLFNLSIFKPFFLNETKNKTKKL